jgi:hypothetical protein
MENNNVVGLLQQLQSFNRPAWRPGTVALGIMAVASFVGGLFSGGPWYNSGGGMLAGLFLAALCNGMEIASAKALSKKAAAPTIPAGMKLVPDRSES